MFSFWPSLGLSIFFLAVFLEGRALGVRATIPLRGFLAFFAYGCIGAPLISLLLQQIPFLQFDAAENARFELVMPAAWLTEPAIEEFAKLLPLLVLAFATAAWRRLSIADLTLAGLASGAGFAFVGSNLRVLVNGISPDFGHLIGLASTAAGGGEADYVFTFAGHAVYTALFGLALGAGLRLYPVRLVYAWIPAAAAYLLACFDHGLFIWKTLHPGVDSGTFVQASGVAEFFYTLTFHGRLEVWLLPLGLVAAQSAEAWLCGKTTGKRPDLMLPCEFAPWSLGEGFAALLRLRQGRTAFLLTLEFFRRRRALAIAKLEASRNSSDRALGQHVHVLEQRLKREHAILIALPPGTWFGPLPWSQSDLIAQAWRTRWLLAFVIPFVALFTIGIGTYPLWLKNTLYGEAFAVALSLFSLGFAGWRSYVYVRLPGLDPITCEGADYAQHVLRTMLFAAALCCGLIPALALPTGLSVLAPEAYGIGGDIGVWLSSGGSLYALMALAAFGGAIQGDHDSIARALRADLASGDAEIEKLDRKIEEYLARDASHAAEASPGDSHGPLSALIAERDARYDEQTARTLALDEYERRTEHTRADDIGQIFQRTKDEFERLQAALDAAAAEQLGQIAALTHSYDRAAVKIAQALDSYDTSHRNLGGLKRETVRPQKQSRELARDAEARHEAPWPDLQAFTPNQDVTRGALTAGQNIRTEYEKDAAAVDADLSAPQDEEPAAVADDAVEIFPRSEPAENANTNEPVASEENPPAEPEHDIVIGSSDPVFERPLALLTAASRAHQVPAIRAPSSLVVSFREISPESSQAPDREPLLLTAVPHNTWQLPARLATPPEDVFGEVRPVYRLEAAYAPLLLPSVPHDARSLPTPFVRGWHEYGFENVPSVDFPDEVYDALFEVVAPIEIPENLPPDAGIELSPVPNEVSTHGPADDERAADEPAPRLWPQDALTKTRRKIFDLPIETQQSAGKPASAIGIANVLGSQAAPARVLLANIEIAVAKRALEAKQSSVLPLPIPGHDRLWNRHADADSADWHFGQFGRMPDEAERNSETQLESSPQRSSERRRLQSLGTQYQEASDRLGDETIFYHLDFLDDGKLPPVTQIEEYNASADEEAREPADEASAVSFEATDVIAVGLQNAAMETAPAKAHEIADAPCEPQEYSAAADIKIDEKTSPDGEDATGSANTDSDIFVAETTTPAIVPDETPSVAAQAEPQVADVAVFGETSNVALTPPLQAEASPAKGWTQRFQTWTRRWLDAGDKPQHSEATIDSDVSSKPTPVAAILPDTVPVEPERTPTKAIASEQLATQSDAWAETWIEIQETLAASNETASEAPIVSDLMPDTVGTGVESSTGESEPVIAAAASERAPEMIEIPTGFAEQPSLDANTAVPLEADPVLIDAEPQIPAVSSEPVAAVSLSAERFTPQTIPVAAEGVSNISLLTVETPLETNASADAAPEVTNAAPADAIPAAQPHAKQDAPESSAPVGEATDALSILRETTEALIKLLGTEAVKTEQIPEMPVAVIANSLREKDDAHTPMFETSIPPPAIAPSVESDVIAVDEVADAAPIVEIKPEKIEARSTRIRSEKPRDKRVRSRTSGERIQPGDSESATPPSDAERPATVKVVGRGKVIKQGNDKKTVNQPTPDNNSRRPAKFFNPGPEAKLESFGTDTLTMAKPVKTPAESRSVGTSLTAALSDYYDKRGKPQPAMHTADAEAFQKIVGSGRLETPRRGPAPWSFSGLPRKGDYAIRLKPASEKFVEFIPSNVSFGQSPRFYPRTVGVGHYENFIPIEHLEYFDVSANRWVPLKP